MRVFSLLIAAMIGISSLGMTAMNVPVQASENVQTTVGIDPDYKPDDAIWEQSLDDESESEKSDKKYRGIRPDLEDEEPA